MLVLRTPKGWTGPREVDGVQIEGTWRAHQVPVLEVREKPANRKVLEDWLRSYRAEELFDDGGRLRPELRALAPSGERRMSANPHANGGALLRDLVLPDFRDYAVAVERPGHVQVGGDARAREVPPRHDREEPRRRSGLFGPDETDSNRLGDVFEVTARAWDAERLPTDENLGIDGRVMEVLSEHQCQGWLEGYLLTGRHGLFNCYEAFIHIVDSMFNQHAKWLKVTRDIPWRRPIASLNYLLSSHVWRQDHNGFSHQDPGFIDHVMNKKAEVIRVYLPPDANTLLSVADHCLRSRNYVNVIVAGKQPALDYLTIDEAVIHCTLGAGIWDWASTDDGEEPDVVLACCGDIPTLETLAAAAILREHLPELKVRVVNVVDLMRLQPRHRAPARDDRRRVRLAVHGLEAGRLRLPRLPVADPPPHLPAHEPRQPPRPRLQGRGDDDDAVRHGDAERPRPLPSGDRRRSTGSPGSPTTRRTCGSRWSSAASPRAPTRVSTATTIRRSATGRGRTDDDVLVVNAGSTSLKLTSSSTDRRAIDHRRLARAPHRRRRGRPPSRARRRAVRASRRRSTTPSSPS